MGMLWKRMLTDVKGPQWRRIYKVRGPRDPPLMASDYVF